MGSKFARGKGRRGRIYMKVFSNATVNTGHTPPRIEPVFAYRTRARPIDDAMARLFGLDETIPTEAREAAEALAKKWELGELASHNTYEHIVLQGGNRLKIFLFWNLSHTEFFVVELRLGDPPIYRRSLGMHSRDFAINAWKNSMVKWLPYKQLRPDSNPAV